MSRYLPALIALSACPPTSPAFHEGLTPSPLNGVWQVRDAGRPMGVVIYELPDGTRWSPHGLVVGGAQAYVTHACRDFRVNASTGHVTAVIGIRSAGRVQPSSASVAALGWDLDPTWRNTLDFAWRHNGTLGAELRSGNTFSGITSLDAGVTLNGAALELNLEAVWEVEPADGGARFVARRDVQQLRLSRELRCE